MSQKHLYERARKRIADQNDIMLCLIFGPNPITATELEKLIERRPELERFRGYIGQLGADPYRTLE